MIVSLTIGDENIKIDTDKVCLIDDISEGMNKVASEIAYYGALHGAALEEVTQVDGYYRQWRAKKKVELLEADPKSAEWKIASKVEADEKFLKFKLAKASAEKNEKTLSNLIKALVEKSQNLRSKGARQRVELESTDMVTKSKKVADSNTKRIKKIKKNKQQ